jgi:hypothetical protein
MMEAMRLFIACSVLSRSPRHHGEQVAGLGERVVPLGKVLAVRKLTLFQQIAVGQQHREALLVGAQQHVVDGHHIRPVQEVGDAAKALGLALREETAARGVEP